MVSLRCKLVVKDELEKLGLHYTSIELGMVEVKENITNKQIQKLKLNLAVVGLELMDDKKSILIDKIKNLIIEMIHYSDELPKDNYSEYIRQKIGYDYTYLTNLYSEVKGTTNQHIIIHHKEDNHNELIV
jgi:hypothetical protein